MIGPILLRLTIWFLLTANLSVPNILLGLAIAFLLPRAAMSPTRLRDLLLALGKILLAVPQAYVEAVQMMLRPHRREEVEWEPVEKGRSPGLIFLDIFLITFTPKTIVLKYDEEGGYAVHYVRRRRTDKSVLALSRPALSQQDN